MKKQCFHCFKRFEFIRNTDVPLSSDITQPGDAIICPWCGWENGKSEKGSVIATRRCEGKSEF